jgi:hypothetical protein
MLQDSEFVIKETFDVISYFFQIGIQEVGTNLRGGNLVRCASLLGSASQDDHLLDVA